MFLISNSNLALPMVPLFSPVWELELDMMAQKKRTQD